MSDDHLDNILGKGKGDPDTYGYPHYVVGTDKPVVHVDTTPTHWSQLPKPVGKKYEVELGDRMGDGSDDQGWDIDDRPF